MKRNKKLQQKQKSRTYIVDVCVDFRSKSKRRAEDHGAPEDEEQRAGAEAAPPLEVVEDEHEYVGEDENDGRQVEDHKGGGARRLPQVEQLDADERESGGKLKE